MSKTATLSAPQREPAKCPRCGRKSLPAIYTIDPISGRRARFCPKCKSPFEAPADARV